jgi:hypothetical protein
MQRLPFVVVALLIATAPALAGSRSGGHRSSSRSYSHSSRSYSGRTHSYSKHSSYSRSAHGGTHRRSTGAAIHSRTHKSPAVSAVRSSSHSSRRGGTRSSAYRASGGSHGRVKRSAAAKDAFKHSHPCPSTGKSSGACPGYVIDHVKALACSGADNPSNMQWQTTAAAKAKDKVERRDCR